MKTFKRIDIGSDGSRTECQVTILDDGIRFDFPDRTEIRQDWEPDSAWFYPPDEKTLQALENKATP